MCIRREAGAEKKVRDTEKMKKKIVFGVRSIMWGRATVIYGR